MFDSDATESGHIWRSVFRRNAALHRSLPFASLGRIPAQTNVAANVYRGGCRRAREAGGGKQDNRVNQTQLHAIYFDSS